ncbi:MFS transporter [Psychromicrobium lacuslunae]|uniref:MFS transporter n=1 Tax=Psychromicrobium lacuslunae TaxID=1618207 RepID=A0A0D4C3C9_9MICC|nr:MFS transporter [Psychromicrobium lacuslunae]AJT43093.1 MFS transporter [Psychromicrobium lacuslunae]
MSAAAPDAATDREVTDPGVTAPISIVRANKGFKDTFAAFAIRNYRYFTMAHFVAVIALWMQRIAQDWIVLQLSGSVTAVGITVALQFAPTLLLGPWGGVLADRFSKRALLVIAQSAAGVLAVVMAVLSLSGALQVWHVYLVAFVLGLVTVVDQPARQVFVNELVGPVQLRNAISINSSIFQLGGMIGPAIAGIMLTAVGGGWAFVVNAVACVFTVTMLAVMKGSDLVRSAPAPRSKGMLAEGARYLVRKPAILYSTIMASFVAVFALSLPVMMAAFADHVFNSGAGGYGLLNTLVAVGALIGALASTRRRELRLRSVVISAGAYGAALVVAALMPSMWSFSAVMVIAGFASLMFLTGANQLVQISTNMQIRGRVMSLYVMVLIGGQALGGLLIGWAAEHLGPQLTLLLSGSVPALAALVVGIILARRGELMLKVNLRFWRPADVLRIVQR